eukprot:1426100-Prymnesium_polylepis.1
MAAVVMRPHTMWTWSSRYVRIEITARVLGRKSRGPWMPEHCSTSRGRSFGLFGMQEMPCMNGSFNMFVYESGARIILRLILKCTALSKYYLRLPKKATF